MPFYIVFAAGRRPIPGAVVMGNAAVPTGLVWDNQPVGVFRADDAELACRAAARKQGTVGTFFAVDGFAWGVELTDVEGAEELGINTPVDPLANRIRDLERQLDIGSSGPPTTEP